MSLLGLPPVNQTLRTYEFTAEAGQTSFSIPNGYTVPYIIVTQNGVRLSPMADFSAVNGTSVELVVAASVGDTLVIDAFGDVSTLSYNAAVANGCVYENNTLISTNYTLSAGKNAMSAGPVSIAAGVDVIIPAGQTWTIV